MDSQNLMSTPEGSQGLEQSAQQAEAPATPSSESLESAQEAPLQAETAMPDAPEVADQLPGGDVEGAGEEEFEVENVFDETRSGRRRRPRTATKRREVTPSRPRPTQRRERVEESLPDLGDGSGYLPPDSVTEEEAQWYIIHCYSGHENKVKSTLEQRVESLGMADRIFEVVVPTEEEIEVREGKRRSVQRQVLPGYVMVRMKMSEETWQVVRNTPGVTRFVGMGNRPQPLDPQEAEQILRRMQAEAPRIKVNFRPGQKVRINEGPFADFMGIVDKIDTERAKVTVLVSFFGRETPVELDFLQVDRI